MPTYDYECKACKHTFSQFQSMKDEAIKICPKCKKKKVERLIGAGAGILFKGSGFYVTDYRKSGYHDKAKADKPSESKPASAPAPAKSDSKPSSSPKKAD